MTLTPEKMAQLRMWAVDTTIGNNPELSIQNAIERAQLLVLFVLGEF